MSTLDERLRALLGRRKLPELVVDMALYRRLCAMHKRMADQDPGLLASTHNGGFEHVLYAALCAGVRESEREDGVRYDENTGRRLP